MEGGGRDGGGGGSRERGSYTIKDGGQGWTDAWRCRTGEGNRAGGREEGRDEVVEGEEWGCGEAEGSKITTWQEFHDEAGQTAAVQSRVELASWPSI